MDGRRKGEIKKNDDNCNDDGDGATANRKEGKREEVSGGREGQEDGGVGGYGWRKR